LRLSFLCGTAVLSAIVATQTDEITILVALAFSDPPPGRQAVPHPDPSK